MISLLNEPLHEPLENIHNDKIWCYNKNGHHGVGNHDTLSYRWNQEIMQERWKT